jgi:enterochelin esterase-like enzyme
VARLTLAFGGLISGHAGETAVIGVCPTVAGTLLAVGSKMDRHPVQRRAVCRTAVVAVAGILLVVGGPAFGDLVNYSPDALMLRGRPPLVGLGGDVSVVNGSGGPWLAWRPSGNGNVVTASLPAPGSGGQTTVDLGIYTPPGYDPTGSRRYPTIYEAPTSFQAWDEATGAKYALDTLIDSGAIPPTIAVFIDTGHDPFLDSECADSVDGREWFARYVSQTVVPWVDSNYRTIAKPAARAIMGNSQGGYCAAIMTLRHPEIFGTSISFSGYFHAGIVGPNSAWPYDGDQKALDAASPDIIAGQLAPSLRANLYFILVSDPNQSLYGPQAAMFDQLLTADGYPHVTLSAEIGHGWVEVREECPTTLEIWASRLVATGVF